VAGWREGASNSAIGQVLHIDVIAHLFASPKIEIVLFSIANTQEPI